MNVLREFQRVGNDLFFARLNNSHSGNMSKRLNRMIAITRTGSMLHRLDFDDIIETVLAGEDSQTQFASREIGVHRRIYSAVPHASAIVHAHPPHVIALSFFADRIVPVDSEGQYYFPDGIPVLSVSKAVASEEVASGILPFLIRHPIAVVRGHGTFAIGADLDEGLHWTSSLDNVAQIILLSRSWETSCERIKGIMR